METRAHRGAAGDEHGAGASGHSQSTGSHTTAASRPGPTPVGTHPACPQRNLALVARADGKEITELIKRQIF